MKMYLFLAILIYKCSNHFSCAEFDLAETSHTESDPSVPLGFNPETENDYSNNNGLVFEFRRSVKSDNTEIEARRRSALDKNFMRFGRTDPVLQRVARASKQANLMRFGRADRGFMRFGRLPSHVPYSLAYFKDNHDQLNGIEDAGDSSEEQLLSKRTPNADEETEISESGEQIKPKQLVYYRRDSPKNLMRFGKRGDEDNFLRVDRANLMRFGRAPANLQRANLLRFGRSNGNLMRFGRSKGNLMRFGRSDPRFLRLIKMDNNFMRFGRSDKGLTSSNGTGANAIANQDSELNHAPDDNNVAQDRTPSSSDEDYEIHLREDLVAPVYVTNK